MTYNSFLPFICLWFMPWLFTFSWAKVKVRHKLTITKRNILDIFFRHLYFFSLFSTVHIWSFKTFLSVFPLWLSASNWGIRNRSCREQHRSFAWRASFWKRVGSSFSEERSETIDIGKIIDRQHLKVSWTYYACSKL